jgi:hypothetical protein
MLDIVKGHLCRVKSFYFPDPMPKIRRALEDPRSAPISKALSSLELSMKTMNFGRCQRSPQSLHSLYLREMRQTSSLQSKKSEYTARKKKRDHPGTRTQNLK